MPNNPPMTDATRYKLNAVLEMQEKIQRITDEDAPMGYTLDTIRNLFNEVYGFVANGP